MTLSASTVSKTPEFPSYRSMTTHVVGGLAGVLRVVSLLHSRRYAVRNLGVSVREGVVESRVDCTVLLTEAEAVLLLDRLKRMPAVVSAEKA
ncbi:hypothetical protein [Amycolatopsis suaedae]|uniref:ACT domain-containing protein n=1 Tax=Amycolatopsis suaedae TaxID=2510978 RepID=A0A4Q7J641_9PSEU|nr:hypothetical protein [Amycolatopsis suaedae]RZQ61464.1 hypothetical protein EWH70_24120 [Amycolatopsis suaedae]